MFDWDLTPMMQRMFGPEEGWWSHSGQFMPEVNLVETDSQFEVTVDLPGMKPEDIHVDINGQELWISGEKKEEFDEKDKTYHRIERRTGEFRRVLPLPGNVDEEMVVATFEDGVLRVSIAKIEEAKTKHVEVKSGV